MLVFDFAFLAALGAVRTDFLRDVLAVLLVFDAVAEVFLAEDFEVEVLALGAGLERLDGAVRFVLVRFAEGVFAALAVGFLAGGFFDAFATFFFVAVFAAGFLAVGRAATVLVAFLVEARFGVAFFADGFLAPLLVVAFFFTVVALADLRGAAGLGDGVSILASAAI